MGNIDIDTVDGFGEEWTRFDQRGLGEQERAEIFDMYFAIFPFVGADDWEGFDLGCGSGRWASLIAPRVRKLHCIDASADALMVAKKNLERFSNCEFHCESVDELSLADASQDFAYSLGVLHHVPDTKAALASCVKKLKTGAPFLVYLYYSFDNRPRWFRLLWRISDCARRTIITLPHGARYWVCQTVAAVVYWPLARIARLAKHAGCNVSNWPLSFYSSRSFYVMRNDALDRFGTTLEQRFTKAEIASMLADAGLEKIQFSDGSPFWCAVAYKKYD